MQSTLSKLSNYCGLNVAGERLTNPEVLIAQKLATNTNNSQPISDLLQYESYDRANNIFFNSDGSGGFCFEINPKVGYDPYIEKNLKLFFNDELPKQAFLQFLMVASHDISVPMSIWESGGDSGGEILKELRQHQKSFLLNKAINFQEAAEGILARNYRSFVCYSTKLAGVEEIKSLIKFQQKLHNKLKAEKLAPVSVDADKLIKIAGEILQMQIQSDIKNKYSPYNNLSDQVCRFGAQIELSADQIDHADSGLVSKIFFPKKLPEEYSLAQMVNLLGSDSKGIPARFVLSYVVSNSLGTEGALKLLNQGNRTLHASEQAYTRHNNAIKKEAAEWRNVIDLHQAQGEIFLKESMQLMLTAPPDEIEIAEEVVKSLWNSQDWQLEISHNTQLISLLSMLPMHQCSTWKQLEHFKMTRNALSGEIAAKLPIQGEWKGGPKSGVLLIGRRGQLLNWNPYHRIGGGGNFNICMMAPPGSGKSFFLQALATDMLKQDVQIFVMDIGSSFKTLCQAAGGELIGFDSRTKISLNPFATLSNSGAKYAKALELLESGMNKEEICQQLKINSDYFNNLKRASKSSDSNEEDIEILEIKDRENNQTICLTKDSYLYAKALVSAMCGVTNSSEGQGLVERIIAGALLKYGQELDVSTLALFMKLEAAKEGNPDAAQLTRMYNSIYPYTEAGGHGRFFKAGSPATFKKPITVFELDAIKDDEPLLAVVLQVILMQITNQFLLGDRSKPFMLIVDEAWRILDYAAGFLESFARTVRKYGGSLVICTQDLSSFDNSKGDRKSQAAVHECCTWKLIGQQDEVGMATFYESESYKKYAGLIESVHKHPENKYAEMLISTNQTKVIGRLVTDPFSIAMYSTEREDFNFLENAEKQNVPLLEALRQLATEKYGLKTELAV
jgi:conjugal transfer ATP-binding protein TraC